MLNHTQGERLAGMGDVFRPVPVQKYQDLPQLTVMAEVQVGTKFKYTRMRQVSVWARAVAYAAEKFEAAGASFPVQFDAIAQEYPLQGQVVFIFNAVVGGVDMYVPTPPFQLSPQQIADLKVAGHWADLQLN